MDVWHGISAAIIIDMGKTESAILLGERVQQRTGLRIKREVPIFREGACRQRARYVVRRRVGDDLAVNVELHGESLANEARTQKLCRNALRKSRATTGPRGTTSETVPVPSRVIGQSRGAIVEWILVDVTIPGIEAVEARMRATVPPRPSAGPSVPPLRVSHAPAVGRTEVRGARWNTAAGNSRGRNCRSEDQLLHVEIRSFR